MFCEIIINYLENESNNRRQLLVFGGMRAGEPVEEHGQLYMITIEIEDDDISFSSIEKVYISPD